MFTTNELAPAAAYCRILSRSSAREWGEAGCDRVDGFAGDCADDFAGWRDRFHQTYGVTGVKRETADVALDRFRRRHHRVIHDGNFEVGSRQPAGCLALMRPMP